MSLYSPSQQQYWRYQVADCTIYQKGKSFKLTGENISSIEIENDYLNNTFPIFKVVFALDNEPYYYILQNKTTVKIYLRIQKYYKMNAEDTNKSLLGDYLKGTFVTIMDEGDAYRDRLQDLESRLRAVDSTQALDDHCSNTLELYLYREETATSIKQQLNTVLKNVNLASTIGYALGKSKVNNVLMSPLENNFVYPILFLPPLSINKLIAHLDACYGFYKAGSLIFFGLDYTYIINFKGGATAYTKGEKTDTCFLVPLETSAEAAQPGMAGKKDGKNYIVWKYSDVDFTNASISRDVTTGTNATVVDANTGTTSSSKVSDKVQTNGDANTSYTENKGGNKWMADTLSSQASANANVLTGSIANFDASALAPNKNISVIFEDGALTNKYKGTYILTYASLKFVSDTGSGDFGLTAAIELRKTGSVSTSSKSV